MKRRKVLGSLALLLLPGAVKAGDSLYGKPVSITGPTVRNDLLSLPLDDSPAAKSTTTLVEAYSTAWRTVLSGEPKAISEFTADPAAFLDRLGLSPLDVHSDSAEVRALLAFTSPQVVKASMSGDYQDFLKKLKESGVLTDTAQSMMRQRIKHALSTVPPESANFLQALANSSQLEVTDANIVQDLNTLISTVEANPNAEQAIVAAVALAYIAVVAVTYVAAASQLIAALNVGTYVTAVTEVAVAIGGGDECTSGFSAAIATDSGDSLQSAAPFRRTPNSIQRELKYATAYREMVEKRILAIGAEHHAELMQASRVAALLHNKKFVTETNRQFIRDEVRMCIEAADEVGILNLPSNNKEQIIERAQNIALRAAMLTS